MDLKAVDINSLSFNKPQITEPEPEPEPEPEYQEDSSPIYHYQQQPSIPEYFPMPNKGIFEDEKIIYIGLFICFVFGFFMGKTLQPIIIKPT